MVVQLTERGPYSQSSFPFCQWINFFGLPIKSYSGLRLLVYKNTHSKNLTRGCGLELLGVWKTPRINKIKLDLDSGLERPTAIYWLSTNQTQSRQNQEKATAKDPTQTLVTTEPTLESRNRKEREKPGARWEFQKYVRVLFLLVSGTQRVAQV